MNRLAKRLQKILPERRKGEKLNLKLSRTDEGQQPMAVSDSPGGK